MCKKLLEPLTFAVLCFCRCLMLVPLSSTRQIFSNSTHLILFPDNTDHYKG